MNMLKAKEVAKMLQVDFKTIYAWAEQGRIPCQKLNGSLRFNEKDILAWMESCKKPVERYNTPCR